MPTWRKLPTTYYLACGGESVYLAPAVTLELVGLRGEVFFFKGLLDYAGIEPQLFSAGAFKASAETFTHHQMEEASRQMSDWLLEDIQNRICKEVSRCRCVTEEEV